MGALTRFLQKIFHRNNPMPTPTPVIIPVQDTKDRPSDLPSSNHYASQDLSLLSKEYNYLWSICQISPKWQPEVTRACKEILQHKAQYLEVESKTKVPWYMVAAIHYREASLDFTTYLGNGDPLNKVSVHVPAGRGPFKTWAAGAVDALELDGEANRDKWTLGDIFHRCEGYNGWGYRINGTHLFKNDHGAPYYGSMQDTVPRNASPYIYNGTQFYVHGASLEDHSFYKDAIDGQPGVMCIFKGLEQMGEKIF